jgi:hypothetical protein
MKKGCQVYVVIYNEEAKAVFDNIAQAKKYIEMHSLENAKINSCQYL